MHKIIFLPIDVLYKSYLKFIHYSHNHRIVRRRLRFTTNDFKQKFGHITPLTDAEKNEIIDFWKPYFPSIKKHLNWFEFYKSFCDNKQCLKYYFPDSIYYSQFDRHLTNPDRSKVFDDKNYYDLFFHDIRMPQTLIHKTNGVILDHEYQIITTEQALNICKSHKSVISKKAVGSTGGKGVHFIEFENTSDNEFIEWLNNNDEIIIQEIIHQHSSLSNIYDKSINTIRIMSLILDGKIHLLSSVLRMGRDGARVDNASSGGIVCGLDKDGCLKEFAYDTKGNRWTRHPQGTIFKGIQIVGYHQCVDLVKLLAGRLNSISKLISWDFAIGVDGAPILIEANYTYGQVDFHQLCNGPILQELTEAERDNVLHLVFKNKD